MKKIFILLIVFIGAIGFFVWHFKDVLLIRFFRPTPTSLEEGVRVALPANDIEVVANDLEIPWEIVFLPDGDMLVTERPGTLKRIGKEKRVQTINGVEHIGEGGLLGMALHPQFKENHWLYLYLTTATDNGLKNRVERYRLEDNTLSDEKIIIDNIPGAAYHDGGRIAFSPDGYLYITTGDAGKPDSAQDINSLAGKILRLKDDGLIPADNPFNNAVYSYGHRNSQGLAWDDKGHLWATEHGRTTGILSGLDELNFIEKGKNYGWPIIQGDEKKERMETPIVQSGTNETWAPAGIIYWNESLFFGGLRGESLYEARLNFVSQNLSGQANINVELKTHFREEFGRIRAVVFGPDGFIYITTSNTDGRGDPYADDDKIIKINPGIFR